MNLRLLFLHRNLLLPLCKQKFNLSWQYRLQPQRLLLRILLPRYSNNNLLHHKLQRNLQPPRKLPFRIIQYLLPSLSLYNPLKRRLLMLLLRLLHFSSLPSSRRLVLIALISNFNLKLHNIISNNPSSHFINPHTSNTRLNKYSSLMLHSIRMLSLVSPLILTHRNKHNTPLHNKLCRVPTRITSDRRKLYQIPLISIPLPLLPRNHKTVLMVRSVSWAIKGNTSQVPIMAHSEVPTMDMAKTSV